MGKQEIKNIDRPVQVWRWSPDAASTEPSPIRQSELLAQPDKPSNAVLPFDNMSACRIHPR
jgi:adenylate cyclase